MDARTEQDSILASRQERPASLIFVAAALWAFLAFAAGAQAASPVWLPATPSHQPEQDQALGNDSLLMSLEFRSARFNALPLAGGGASAMSPDGDRPALVPLAPPAWAGMAILGVLAYARHKQRRRDRTI